MKAETWDFFQSYILPFLYSMFLFLSDFSTCDINQM